MSRFRIGVVLLVPEPVATEVDGLRRALGDGSLGRIPPHLTLVPPRNLKAAELEAAEGALRAAAAASAPFSVALGPVATFVPVSPVAYLEVRDPHGAVAALLERLLVPPLDRPRALPFVPHVTVADEADPARLGAAVTALASYRATVRFDRVHLLAEGRDHRWAPLADARLAAPAVVGRGGLAVELERSERLGPQAAALVEAERARGEARGETGRPVALTARREGTVVGAAEGEAWLGEFRLHRLVVDPAVRGEGVGAHLLRAVEAAAAEEGCGVVRVRVASGGPAEAFLVRHGYAPVAAAGGSPGAPPARLVELERTCRPL